MELVKSKKEIINYIAVSDILDKISNWPKNPEIIESNIKARKFFYLSLFYLFLNLLTIFFISTLAEFISKFCIFLILSYYCFNLCIELYKTFKKTRFNIFISRLSLMKNDIQHELEFITWLQKFRIIDRKFACERINANHNKHIQFNNLLLGNNIVNMGKLLIAVGCIISIVVNIFKISLDNSSAIIIQLTCMMIGIFYIVAFIDQHIQIKVKYFTELISTSILLDTLEQPNIHPVPETIKINFPERNNNYITFCEACKEFYKLIINKQTLLLECY